MKVQRVDRFAFHVHPPTGGSRTDYASGRTLADMIDPVTGFLIVEGRLARGECVQTYSDGASSWGELRRERDVFDRAALASMSPRPIVDSSHTWVDTSNWSATSKGMVGEARIEQLPSGPWVIAELVIADAAMVELALTGEALEISLGYECQLVPERGTFAGQAYDYRQTQVRVNHAALGPRNWARAGNEARLLYDAGRADGRHLFAWQQRLGDSSMNTTSNRSRGHGRTNIDNDRNAMVRQLAGGPRLDHASASMRAPKPRSSGTLDSARDSMIARMSGGAR